MTLFPLTCLSKGEVPASLGGLDSVSTHPPFLLLRGIDLSQWMPHFTPFDAKDVKNLAFTSATLEFLFENRMRNSRTWYQEHKADLNRLVVQPCQDLVRELTPFMLQVDDQIIVEPRVDRTISRIYRDVRRIRDGMLYRDVVWLQFARDKKVFTERPSFYFEFSPRGYNYGCGFYRASPATMKKLRELILQRDPAFQTAFEAFQKQTLYHLEGDCYKRSPHPQEPPELRNFLDRRSICAVHDGTDPDLLFSPQLGQQLIQDLKPLIPLYHLFLKAEQLSEAEAEDAL